MRDDDHDDNALAGIDLDAWAPPPPPAAGALADAVVAQMRESAGAPARSPAGAPARGAKAAGATSAARGAGAARRRWPIVASVAAVTVAVAAAGVLVLSRFGSPPAPASGSGELRASRASHLELGPSSAELDPGAEVRWWREGRRIAAAQPRGAALWRVAAEDTLVIDAGATVASVEASGASLRVEAKMNLSDARMFGASAVTAAAVALVTVIVYQGHVRVTSGGQTVLVEPGSTFEVRPRDLAEDAPTVGAASPEFEQMKRELRELQERVLEAEQALAARETQAPGDSAPAAAPATTTPPPAPPAPGACDADELAERGRDAFAAGQQVAALRFFELAYACRPDQLVAQKAFIVACNLPSLPKARVFWKRLSPVSRQRVLMICVRNGIPEDALNEPDASSATLQISSRPPAKVFVDDKPVGTSPLTIEVAPGRRRVRFQVGADKFSFTVNAKAGETVTLDKQLQ
jgi:PEGA domain